jgi:hypothetical protein
LDNAQLNAPFVAARSAVVGRLVRVAGRRADSGTDLSEQESADNRTGNGCSSALGKIAPKLGPRALSAARTYRLRGNPQPRTATSANDGHSGPSDVDRRSTRIALKERALFINLAPGQSALELRDIARLRSVARLGCECFLLSRAK